jgi:hypothetical protein
MLRRHDQSGGGREINAEVRMGEFFPAASGPVVFFIVRERSGT